MAELDEDITKVPSGTGIYDAQDYIRKCRFWKMLRDYEQNEGEIHPVYTPSNISDNLEEYNEKWSSIVATFSNNKTLHLTSLKYLKDRNIELLSQIMDEDEMPRKDVIEAALASIKSVVSGNKFNIGPFCFVITDSPAGITRIKNTYVRVIFFPVMISDEEGREVIDYISLAKDDGSQSLSFLKDFDDVSPIVDSLSSIIFESMKMNMSEEKDE